MPQTDANPSLGSRAEEMGSGRVSNERSKGGREGGREGQGGKGAGREKGGEGSKLIKFEMRRRIREFEVGKRKWEKGRNERSGCAGKRENVLFKSM